MKKEVSAAVDHSNNSALASMRRVKASEDRVKEVQAQRRRRQSENAGELNRKLKRNTRARGRMPRHAADERARRQINE